MEHKISVIIPTYNRGYCIKRAIDSVLQQTYPVFEIIIVDDCSSDNTYEIIQNINDERIIYVRNDENQGPSISRNIGVKKANGDYIAFLDSDDTWREDKLKKQICIVEKGYKFVFSKCVFWEEGKLLFEFPAKEWIRQTANGWRIALAGRNGIDTSTMLIEKGLFQKNNGFSECLYSYEDWEMVLRISKQVNFGFVQEVLVDKTKSIDSVNDMFCNNKEQLKALFSIYKEAVDIIVSNRDVWNSQIEMLIWQCSYLEQDEEIQVMQGYSRVLGIDESIVRSCYESEKNNYKMNYIVGVAKAILDNMDSPQLTTKWKEAGIDSVVIYGKGILGKLLFQYLNKWEIKVEYFIDKVSGEYAGINTYSLEQAVELSPTYVIFTVFDYGKLKRIVKEQLGNTSVITIDNFVDSI